MHDLSFLLYCILIMIGGESFFYKIYISNKIYHNVDVNNVDNRGNKLFTIIPIPTISSTSLLVRNGSKYSRVQ